MEDILISWETYKLAKEKGFTNKKSFLKESHREYVDHKGEGIGEYYSHIARVTEEITPIQSLLQRWLREKHKIHIVLTQEARGEKWYYDIIQDFKKIRIIRPTIGDYEFNTYEDALESALQDSLKLIK